MWRFATAAIAGRLNFVGRDGGRALLGQARSAFLHFELSYYRASLDIRERLASVRPASRGHKLARQNGRHIVAHSTRPDFRTRSRICQRESAGA